MSHCVVCGATDEDLRDIGRSVVLKNYEGRLYCPIHYPVKT